MEAQVVDIVGVARSHPRAIDAVLDLTCLKMATTFGPFKNYWDTEMSARQWFTHMY